MATSTHTGTCAICNRAGLKLTKKGDVARHGHQGATYNRGTDCKGSSTMALEIGNGAFLEMANSWSFVPGTGCEQVDEVAEAGWMKKAEEWTAA